MFDRLPVYIKPTAFLSAIAGLGLGVLLVIPIIQLFLPFVFWIIGGVIVHILKKNNFIGQFTQKEGIIVGCVAGMVSIIAAAITFIPLSMLIGAIFKTASVSFLFATSFFSSIFSLFVLFMMIFFCGLVNIIFNIGSSLSVIAIYNNFLEEKKDDVEFKVEL